MPDVELALPDHLESSIAEALHAAARSAGRTPWKDAEWTSQLKNRIGHLPEAAAFKVYANRCDFAENREWLFDMIWTDEPGGYVVDVPLILESEWKNPDEVSSDFQKLMVGRARHRIMLFSSHSTVDADEIQEGLLEEVRRFRLGQGGDRYMFGCYIEDKEAFCISHYVVSGSSSLPATRHSACNIR